MGRKYTTEIVRDLMAKEDYTLNSEYKNTTDYISVTCPKGHTRNIQFKHWLYSGSRCGECHGLNKHTQESVKATLEKEEFTMLGSYKNVDTPFEALCPKGHKVNVIFYHFQKGIRCRQCGYDKRTYSPEHIRHDIESGGYTIIGDIVSHIKPMETLCPNGHTHTVKYKNWRAGYRCKTCLYDPDKAYVEFKESLEKEDFILITPRWMGGGYRHSIICPLGHENTVCRYEWEKGVRCGVCAYLDSVEKKKLTQEYVESIVNQDGYKLLVNYESTKIPLTVQCPKGHVFNPNFGAFRNGTRCPSCAKYGFDQNKPGILYYLKFIIDGKNLYKIGITNKTIEDRFYCEPIPYEVIMQKQYLSGLLAREEEKKILTDFKSYLYTGPDLLKSGNTELFTKDVLNLDNAQNRRKCLTLN